MIVLKTTKDDLDRVAFAADGRGLVAAGKSGVLWWPTLAESTKPRSFGQGKATTVGITPDGGWVVAAGPRIGVRAFATADGAEKVIQRVGVAYWASVSPTDPLLVTCHINGRTLNGWKLTAGSSPVTVWTVEAGPLAADGTFTPDGSAFVHFSIDTKRQPEPERKLVYRQPDTGAELRKTRTVPAHPWDRLIVASHKDLIATFVLGELSVREVKSNAPEVFRVAGEKGKHITAAAFHPSDRYLATTSNDETVKLYDTANWSLARTFTWNIGRLRSIAFSPDGLLAAAGSDTGKIVVWDVDF